MSESFYNSGDVPSISFFNNSNPIALGVKMVLPAGTISAGRWYYPDQNAPGLVWRLYSSALTTPLVSAAPDAITQQTFVTFSTAVTGGPLPLHVAAGTYWSVIETGAGGLGVLAPYSAIPGFYASPPVTRGDLVFGASKFADPPPLASGSSDSAAAYMTDIVFQADGAARVPDLLPLFW